MLQDLDIDQRTNYEQNMTDAVSVFPRLLTGLDVNVKFGRYSRVFVEITCLMCVLVNLHELAEDFLTNFRCYQNCYKLESCASIEEYDTSNLSQIMLVLL